MVLEIFLCSVSTLVLSTTKWDVIRKKFKNVNNGRILHNWEVRMVCGPMREKIRLATTSNHFLKFNVNRAVAKG